MDRAPIYEKWLKTTYIGQEGKETPLCDDGTLSKFDRINDHNFGYYVDYQEYYISQGKKVSSIPTRRSEIYEFLIFIEGSGAFLEDVTEDMLNTHMLSRKRDSTKSTFTNRISYLSGFFAYLHEKGIISFVFDSLEYKSWAKELPDPKENKEKPLNLEQVSKFRQMLIDQSYDYPKYREYLYVFDMLYYTQFNDNQIQNLSLRNNVDVSNRVIKIDEVKATVPQEVIDNIVFLDSSGKLGQLLRVLQYVKYMKPLLNEIGFENVRKTDIVVSKDNLSFRCPQCNTSFEATIDNWCARQYSKDGKLWIVCKRCGNA